MKNLCTILLFSLLFIACKKDKTDDFPYTGSWEGTYSGSDNGTWKGDVTSDGTFTGTATTNLAPGFPIAFDGTVNETGALSADLSIMGYTLNFAGQIAGNAVTGTWTSSTPGLAGTFNGQRK